MGTELLLLAGAGFALLKMVELFSPWRPKLWQMPGLLFLCGYVAHFIPQPWLLYVAVSGVIPLLYMLSGGASAASPGQDMADRLLSWIGHRRELDQVKRTMPSRTRRAGRPRSAKGSRIPPV